MTFSNLAGLLRDRWLAGAIVAGVAARGVLPILWPSLHCFMDECYYLDLAKRLPESGSIMESVGPERWLWAPGYPYLIRLSAYGFGDVTDVRWLQIGVATLTIPLIYLLSRALFERRAARIAAWLYGLHPTLAFYAGRAWSETFYSSLLLAAVAATLWCRSERASSARFHGIPVAVGVATGVGILVGSCILMRGVSTYTLPLFLLAILWPSEGAGWREGRRRVPHALAAAVACVALVLPYSVAVSREQGGLVVSDATLGRMMWLGNNGFSPMTFDYGNGALAGAPRTPRAPAVGASRPSCASANPEASAVQLDRCETRMGLKWIRSHPAEFIHRIPLRLAQLFNPHSFFTRHLRMDRYPGIPSWLEASLSVVVVIASVSVLFGGVVGACARGRGPHAVLVGAIVGYHVLSIALLAGLTRYRVPLVPLWIPYAAVFFADPGGTLRTLRSARGRMAACVLAVVVLVPLTLWFLPAGFSSAN